ncbi:serine carboxypeptidase [Ceratobasidium sp. AG-I]|nr:serine carboxypeptidase [Ceratobasidium sp. AG-I]
MVFLLSSVLIARGLILDLYIQPVIALRSPWVAPSFGGVNQTYRTAKKSAYGSQAQILDLATLSSEGFVTVGHQYFPSYQVRVKRVEDFCDTTVKAYSGYLDVEYGTKHLFFYFFESRRAPDADPVLMWINGGPGCSSATGLFMELGPCTIHSPQRKGSNGTNWNPHSWNNKANIFFLDQPVSVGVGFSYAEFGQEVNTTEQAAKNVHAFVAIFFETFGGLKGREFHMAGESYGGRYIPVFAAEIIDQNKHANARGFTPINLKSVLIGNGVTDFKSMYEAYYYMQCMNISMSPVQDISKCVLMRHQLSRCLGLFQTECIERFDKVGCMLAASFCDSVIFNSFFSTGRNPFDMTKSCSPEQYATTSCYEPKKYIADFLDRPDIRDALGVDPSIGNFTGCSSQVDKNFYNQLDLYHPTQLYVSGLLERGVRVLIYAGTYDYMCNWLGNYNWVLALDWTGKSLFVGNKRRNWLSDGQVAGFVESGGGLTFATINAAGHMVPYDKPKESLTMLNQWLMGSEL